MTGTLAEALKRQKESQCIFLDLSGQDLETIPPALTELDTLQQLDLSFNALEALPTDFQKLQNLTHLYLTGNKFRTFPSSLSQLPRLKVLCLNDNQLADMPTDLYWITKLDECNLEGNPLAIPFEIISGSVYDPPLIVSYVESRNASDNSRYFVYAPVKLLGDGGVGKTSLVHSLLGHAFACDTPCTRGVRVSNMNFEMGSIKYEFVFWDIGGQEVLHAVYTFLFSRVGIFLILLDYGATEDRVVYWINMARSICPNCPIILVRSKIDLAYQGIDFAGIERNCDQVITVINVSSLAHTGIDELKHTIAEVARELPRTWQTIPKEWLVVRDVLWQRSEAWIHYREYQDICWQNGVRSVNEQTALAEFLNGSGICIHLQQDVKLDKVMILHVEKVVEAMSRIMLSESLWKANGRLYSQSLSEYINDVEFPRESYDLLIDIMSRFDLCFELPAERPRAWIIPSALSKGEPDTGDWSDSAKVEYHYGFLADGILWQFIATVAGEFAAKAYWRRGVLLAPPGSANQGLVRCDPVRKTITISVRGAELSRGTFIGALRSKLSEINRRIPQLDVEERVPLPNVHGRSISLYHLKSLDEAGVNTWTLDGTGIRYEVKELLTSIGEQTSELRRQREQEMKKEVPRMKTQPDIYIGRIMMGDTYSAGQAGVMGPQSQARDINFHQLWIRNRDGLDFSSLASELASLRSAMREEAISAEHDVSVGEVAAAEQAAKGGDGARVLEHLAKAGKWALDIATKIGVDVVTAAAKLALGL